MENIDKISKFYYSLKQFNSAMEAYTKSLQDAQAILNRKKAAEKNNDGWSRIAVEQYLTQLDTYSVKCQKEINDRIKEATDAFENIKSFLKD